jgi:N-acetyl-gamma-glutamyl-phosphate reductase
LKVFIDGSAGTTGLQVRDRLAGRKDITLVSPPEASRKDPDARRLCMLESDATILCLPDEVRVVVALVVVGASLWSSFPRGVCIKRNVTNNTCC